MNYLLLNAPRKFLDGFSWYGEPPYQRDGVVRIRQKLIELLNELEAQGWKSKDIFLFGFSQGCLISADLACITQKNWLECRNFGYFHFFPRWKSNINTKAKKNALVIHPW